MSYIDRNYIHCKGISEINSFEIHYGHLEDIETPFKLVLKVISEKFEKDYTQNLVPGLLDLDNVFHKLPIRIFYTQIDSLKNIYLSSGYSGTSRFAGEITLYNKEFTKYRKIVFDKKSSGNGGFMILEEIVNFTNRFIDKNNDIDDIDFDKLLDHPTYRCNDENIWHILSNLKFEFFSNSMNRVGKDNSFWDEAVITGLPTDVYLNKLILQYFKKDSNSAKPHSDSITITFNHDKGWCPSHPRTVFENPQLELEFRLKLSQFIGKSYSQEQHQFLTYSLKERTSDEDKQTT